MKKYKNIVGLARHRNQVSRLVYGRVTSSDAQPRPRTAPSWFRLRLAFWVLGLQLLSDLGVSI